MKQLLAVVRNEAVEDVKTVIGLGDLGRDVLTGVINCLAKQLCPTTGKVVIGRATRCAAVLEHIGDRGRLRPAFPDQQRGRDHHPLAGSWHVAGSFVLLAMYVTLHNRGALH